MVIHYGAMSDIQKLLFWVGVALLYYLYVSWLRRFIK